jgi:hypothetical protein
MDLCGIPARDAGIVEVQIPDAMGIEKVSPRPLVSRFRGSIRLAVVLLAILVWPASL